MEKRGRTSEREDRDEGRPREGKFTWDTIPDHLRWIKNSDKGFDKMEIGGVKSVTSANGVETITIYRVSEDDYSFGYINHREETDEDDDEY